MIVTIALSGVGFCEWRADGSYPDPERCDGYIDCIEGIAKKGICPSPYLWNDEERECDMADNVNCVIGIAFYDTLLCSCFYELRLFKLL